KTAWLTDAFARIRRMAAGESFNTGVRHARSNSRIVFVSIAPALCRSDMLSCSAANASLLYAFAMSRSFAWSGNLKEGFLFHDCRDLFFAVAEVDSCGLPESPQFIRLDIRLVLLF